MKSFFTIAILVLIAQVSLAANIKRFKRADEVETAVGDFLALGRDLIDMSITIGDAVVAEIPEEEAYHSHKKDLTDYLDAVKAIRSEKDNCVLKTVSALKALAELFAKYNDDENETESSEESEETAKAVEEIFKNAGGEEFENKAKAFFEKYFNFEFLQKVENYNEEDVEKWALVQQVC